MFVFDSFSNLANIGRYQIIGVGQSVHMASLIAVTGADTGTDHAMAHIITGTQGTVSVGAVEGIYIDGVVDLRVFGCWDWGC